MRNVGSENNPESQWKDYEAYDGHFPISLAVKNFSERGVGSSYAVRPARSPALAGEYDLTTLTSVRDER